MHLIRDPVIETITIRHIKLELGVPYHLSYRTFTSFEPYVVEVVGSDGSKGWGDGHISPGSSDETRESGWAFCKIMAPQLVGRRSSEALELLLARAKESKVACSALSLALEVLQQSPLLNMDEDYATPLITPVNAFEPEAIENEIEAKLAQGFRTFKVKVGKDIDADLTRLGHIQKFIAGRAKLRVDANRGYSKTDGITFATSVSPDGLELFEQPCAAEDWESNAAVAAVSNVPLMLDEPICTLTDIERAGEIKGVGYCKLKLKRFGTLANLYAGLHRVHELGMEAVLGDGLGSELTSWMEACVAQKTIRTAGEFNGFLKPKDQLFMNPLIFASGNLTLIKGYRPSLDTAKLEKLTEKIATFTR